MLKTEEQRWGEIGDALTNIEYADPVRRHAAELRQRDYGRFRDVMVNRHVGQNATVSKFEALQ